MREKNDFSLPTASRLSRVGWISRALAFRPEKKWGLLVAYRWGKMLVWQSRYLCLLNPQIPVFFYYYFSFFSGANPYITVNPWIYVTVFRELSNLPQVTFQNGRFSGAMLALLTRKSSIIVPTHPYWRIYCMLFVSYYVLSVVLSLKIYRIFWVAQQMI